jgi:hypothetical protein
MNEFDKVNQLINRLMSDDHETPNEIAERQINELFDTLVMLRSMTVLPNDSAALVMSMTLDALQPDQLRAMTCTLIGLVTNEQLVKGREQGIELARSGYLVEEAARLNEEGVL